MALLTPGRRAIAMRAAALLLGVALAAGCSQRERANPLDPLNPNTSGAPTGFTAVALSNQVLLSWNREGNLSTRLYRRAQGQADFTAITSLLPAFSTLHTDPTATNGVTWEYRLYFADDTGTLGPPTSAIATPSPVLAWTADAGRGSLIRLAADGREIAFEQPNFGVPSAIAYDRDRQQLWLSDALNGRVVLYVPATGLPVSVTGFNSPGVIAVDPADGSAWISDRLDGTIRHVANGGATGVLPEVPLLDQPSGIDVDPQSRVLWVCEWNGNTVRRYGSNGQPLGAIAVDRPWRVAVDSLNGEGWVTSYETGRVLHLSTGLATLHTITSAAGPAGIAVDARRGRIWIADYDGNRVIALRRDGTEEFRVGGLDGPLEVSVERTSGEAWVTLNHSVARVAPGGPVLTTARGLIAPVGVGLDRLAN